MAYSVPTYDQFIARYPVFQPASEALVRSVLAEAAQTVGAPGETRWLERDYAPAIRLLTAHNLIVEGVLSGGSGSADGTYAGPITKERVGDVEVTYGGSSSSSDDGVSNSANPLASTSYGRQYLALMRANFGGPLVA
ncbi:DUF4054 domain-containing protein [Aureimonas flava]|uniref:DUF4054 domain-containing protein n=1 Tax=Aureimonas flava TaxID=2320271 RepID=A0A3A1WL71_9HYPH|nr:DUF4054 domain-containing protein [Aureimonas flava]RIY00211.1 DUF4054 domain-containing protein [Aureimonas flava]